MINYPTPYSVRYDCLPAGTKIEKQLSLLGDRVPRRTIRRFMKAGIVIRVGNLFLRQNPFHAAAGIRRKTGVRGYMQRKHRTKAKRTRLRQQCISQRVQPRRRPTCRERALEENQE